MSLKRELIEPCCDFCQIAQGKDKTVKIICEDAAWVAFFPLNPATPGHTLIIPRKHVPDLWKAEITLGADLMSAVIRVGCAITAAVEPDGMNLITSAGTVAEQSVFHLHLHVVPRWRRDNIGPIWPPSTQYRDVTLEDIADKIRAACSIH